MNAFVQPSNYYDSAMSEDERNQLLECSMTLLTIAEDTPMQQFGRNSSSSQSLNPSMSRTKSYKVDLSCLSESQDIPLSKNIQAVNNTGAPTWGYYVDTVASGQ